jgi:uncharacterized damage-inducible protein DinB
MDSYSTNKTYIRHLLDTGADAFRQSLKGVSPEQASASGNQERWSILQCAEHVVLVEEWMLHRLRTAERSPEPTANPAREAAIAKSGGTRTRKFEAPAPVRPNGRFENVQDALHAFDAIRAQTLLFLAEFPESDLHYLQAVHPVIGPSNACELLLLIAVHPARHAGQIEELRAAPQPSL